MADESATSFCLKVVANPPGPRTGLRAQRITTVIKKRLARSNPGRMPAMKSLPMDCSAMIP